MTTQIPEFDEIIEPNDQTEARREHLEKLRELVGNAYPNKFERSRLSGSEDTITNLLAHADIEKIAAEMAEIMVGLGELERPPADKKDELNFRLKALGNVRIAGRMAVPPRVMGKAAFVHLSDGISRLQIYVRKQDAVAISNDTGEAIDAEGRAWEVFGNLDHGDFIGVEGYLFITNTGELSVHVEKLQFLAKAMLPMPDKMHGIADPEIRQRQRYADLIASSLQIEHDGLTTREVFERRAKLISSIRRYLEDHGYIEVETPMLTPKATGAAAKPFETHHNALDIPLYARIAPELYLKRLVVGGFEKVYELNRNFRNEGISFKHNPEFTMLEFYCAYMDVNGMMDFCERLLTEAFMKAQGKDYEDDLAIEYENRTINLNVFSRFTMKDAIFRVLKDIFIDFDRAWLEDPTTLLALVDVAKEFDSRAVHLMRAPNEADVYAISSLEVRHYQDLGWDFVEGQFNRFYTESGYAMELFERRLNYHDGSKSLNPGGDLAVIFEHVAEKTLIDPTFIIDFPKSISPLSKASPENPQIAERFELFINGMEVANGFSELNDPREQYDRFADQMKAREGGDEEAMVLDEDYIRALSYGMPPAAGIGIGIDRLTMLLTNKHSIRDVILFPHMRPERKNAADNVADGDED